MFFFSTSRVLVSVKMGLMQINTSLNAKIELTRTDILLLGRIFASRMSHCFQPSRFGNDIIFELVPIVTRTADLLWIEASS